MTSKTEGLYPRVAPTLLQREYSVRLPRGSVVGRGTVPTPPRLTAVSFMRGCRLYPRVAPTLLQREYSVRLPRGSVVGRGTAPTPRLTAVSSLLVVANRSLFFLSSQTFVRLQTFTYTHLFLHAACIAHACAKLSLLSSPSSLGGCSMDRAAAGGRSCLHAYL